MTLLTHLSRSNNEQFTFQTFDDNADRKDKSLIRQFYGTLDQHANTLHELNSYGAGVYVTVNATDGNGRTAKNITAVRALFVDFDTPDNKRLARLLSLPITPSVIVESSKNKHHAYWVVDGVALDEFSSLQKQLIAYFTHAGDAPDKAIHDLPRVMRLDGFTHQKVKDGVASPAFVSRIVYEGVSANLNELRQWLDNETAELLTPQVTPEVAPKVTHASHPVASVGVGNTDMGSGQASAFVRKHAQGNWQFVLNRLGYSFAGGKHEPCPHCGGKDRFRFDDNNITKGDGGWICSQGGNGTVGGDGLSFLIDHVGTPAKDAVSTVAGVLNLTLPQSKSDDIVASGDISAFIQNIEAKQNAPMSVGALERSCDIKLAKYDNTKAVPEQLLSFPVPVLNDVLSWVEGFSRQPHRQISIQGVIALASVLCGRIYQSTEANTSSLYLMVLGETGVGKNYVKTAIQQFFTQSNMINLLSGSGNTSSGAVYSALYQSPCHIQIIDEIGKQLQTARKQQNGQMAESFTTLVEAYSASTSLMMPKNYSSMGRKKEDQVSKQDQMVHCPAITLLGLATPAQMYDNLSTADVEDGFLNRLVCVDISLPLGAKVRRQSVPLPDCFVDWATKIRNPAPSSRTDMTGIDTAHNAAPSPRQVLFTDDALDLFDDTAELIEQKEADGVFALPDMTRRWVENAMRLATMLAVCKNSDEPVIDAELAHWALSYILHYGQEFMDRVSTKVADSDFHRLYLKIFELVERAGKNGMTERDLARNSRLFAASTPVQREMAFKALLAEEQIVAVAIATISGRGRKRACYLLPKLFDGTIMEMTA